MHREMSAPVYCELRCLQLRGAAVNTARRPAHVLSRPAAELRIARVQAAFVDELVKTPSSLRAGGASIEGQTALDVEGRDRPIGAQVRAMTGPCAVLGRRDNMCAHWAIMDVCTEVHGSIVRHEQGSRPISEDRAPRSSAAPATGSIDPVGPSRVQALCPAVERFVPADGAEVDVSAYQCGTEGSIESLARYCSRAFSTSSMMCWPSTKRTMMCTTVSGTWRRLTRDMYTNCS